MQENEHEYEAVAGLPYHDLNDLLAQGIDKATIKKLCDNNIRTVERVHMEPLKNLVAINGLSEAKAKKVRDEALKLLGWTKFTTAADRLARSKEQWVRAGRAPRGRSPPAARAGPARSHPPPRLPVAPPPSPPLRRT